MYNKIDAAMQGPCRPTPHPRRLGRVRGAAGSGLRHKRGPTHSATPPPIPESYDGTGTTGRGDMIDDQGNIINVSKKVKRIRATPTHYN